MAEPALAGPGRRQTMSESWRIEGEYLGGIPGVIWTRRVSGCRHAYRPSSSARKAAAAGRASDALDVEIEGIEGREPGTKSWIDNVRHPVSSRLAAARATRMTYRDHVFAWNNTGRNGHY